MSIATGVLASNNAQQIHSSQCICLPYTLTQIREYQLALVYSSPSRSGLHPFQDHRRRHFLGYKICSQAHTAHHQNALRPSIDLLRKRGNTRETAEPMGIRSYSPCKKSRASHEATVEAAPGPRQRFSLLRSFDPCDLMEVLTVQPHHPSSVNKL